jgi:hypothetical protein
MKDAGNGKVQEHPLNGSRLSGNGQKTQIDLLISALRELCGLLQAVTQQNSLMLQLLMEREPDEDEPVTYLDGSPVKR